MILSKHAIESMGFTAISSGEPIEAAFHSVHVFEVRGFTIKEAPVVAKASASGTEYTLAIGRSVNEVCNTILDNMYSKDENAWAKEYNCTPPYAIVHFGPTIPHRVTEGYARTEDGDIITYDAFGAACEQLRQLETRALASVEMALTCVFSSEAHTVEFKPVDRTIFGITPDGITVHDVRITASGSGYVSKPLTGEDIESGIQSVVKLAGLLDHRVSRFFQLGLHDQDDLKRFLYYFLAIEIEVHRVFRTVSRAQHVTNGVTLDPRVSSSLASLIESRLENWKNLTDRFVWCVVSVWKHLSDDDIGEFKRLKKVRDRIAHGEIASPDPAAVVAVENLVMKIHG